VNIKHIAVAAASLTVAGLAHAEPALGGAAQMEARIRAGLQFVPTTDEETDIMIDHMAHGDIKPLPDGLIRVDSVGNFTIDPDGLQALSGSVGPLPGLAFQVKSAAPASNRAIVGIGLRMTNGSFVTLWVKRRTLNADGTLGAIGAWEKFGAEPNSQPEKLVEIPAGKVAVGVGGSVDNDTVVKLGVKHRGFDKGYLGAEGTAGDAAPYEQQYSRPLPFFLTEVGFLGTETALLQSSWSDASFLFTSLVGTKTGTPQQRRCPAGTEGVGTVQRANSFDGISRISAFGLVCGPKALVNTPPADLAEYPEAQLHAVGVSFQGAAGGVFPLVQYKASLAGEVVKLCPVGYTLQTIVTFNDNLGVRRIETLGCKERAATPGNATQNVAVGVGSMPAVIAPAVLTVPVAGNSPDGLIAWSDPFLRGFGLHHLPR
jgi:hypothetical protein